MPGPPPVMTQMSVKTPSVWSVVSMRLVAIERRIMGSVMRRKLWSAEAPSICADSLISGGTSDSAAWYCIIEKAVPRQTLARMTESMGKASSHLGPSRPTRASIEFRVPSEAKKA